MQESLPWNWRNSLGIFMIVTCLVLSSWFHVSLCKRRISRVIQTVVHLLQTAECSTAISSEGDIRLESSSRYCLALMSNWNVSGCLPLNVILYCTLATLEDKTLCIKAGGKWGRIAFPTFYKYKLMSHWELTSKHQPLCFMFVLMQLILQWEMFAFQISA